ncbi:putative lipoprotein [Burkholderia pseudomallei MSHR4012]|nr:putative lipoprotein [Burkholderia pseudomallei MSHR4012]
MKKSHTKGFAKLASVAAVGAALTACGGGGGSGSSSGSTTASTSQLSGKAIDGYLAGATVCFDNGQGACDTSLPSTTTDANGNYTLKVSGDTTGKQLDVLVTSNTTDGGNKFTSTFTMSAIVSGGSQNVTPLTTMIVAQVKAGKSQADATAAVQKLVGSTSIQMRTTSPTGTRTPRGPPPA